MDADLKEQFDNYFEMFRTKGWKQFQEDMQDIYDSYRIENIKDETQLAYIKGERRILNQVLRFEGGIKTNYDIRTEREND